MKRILFLAYLFLASLHIPLLSKIIETQHFNEIINYIDSETLVILDIDDTLLIPVQTMGTDVWFNYRLKLYQTKESPSLALDKALAEWEAIRHITEVKIVEENSEKIIENLQRNKTVVMGLTTQGLALASRTVTQLNSLNIDLSKTAPSNEDHYFINRHGVLYRQGILFTSGTPKGAALLKFLEKIGFIPKHVVFINDKQTHLHDVEKSVVEKGIKFTGLRYAYSDQRVKNFRPEIADIQWKYSTFNHLISDEDAESLLQKNLNEAL